MRNLRRFAISTSILFSFFAFNPAFAQVTEGSLSGTVTDPSGASVSEAHVTVTNVATQESRAFTTDQTGIYRIGYLQPGIYSVTAEHQGFKKEVVQGIKIERHGNFQ